ncbi:enoyl-CoA hydratase-related protein [Rhodococcus sp. X156]|uniref:enoyl-CoA hydratase-related protein n=1 Tax=Rhodococcus sp. X156 TaxID=2499145 RepID=UPI000FD97BB7|nr:enoyl-CoA hydratase-related protein [Rhodococcus sp. X156]
MPYLQRDGDVFVLNLGEEGAADTENRFSPDFLAQVHALLDEVEASTGNAALVTTGTGKFYSNGLDLDWLAGHLDQTSSYVGTIQSLFARVLLLPMATVAAVQGHAFAGGGMLAVAHDEKVMRADRGFFCLPEVDINIPFTPGMAALLQARLSKATAHTAMTTGRRYGGADAAAAGIVDEAVGQEQVLERAMARAQALVGKRGDTLGAIKQVMYGPAAAALTAEATISFDGNA